MSRPATSASCRGGSTGTTAGRLLRRPSTRRRASSTTAATRAGAVLSAAIAAAAAASALVPAEAAIGGFLAPLPPIPSATTTSGRRRRRRVGGGGRRQHRHRAEEAEAEARNRRLIIALSAPPSEEVDGATNGGGSGGDAGTKDGDRGEGAAAAATKPVPPRPTYPKSAYYLSVDEERLEHRLLSFMDTLGSSGYGQVARLIEPRRYARSEQFHMDMRDVEPTVDDVAPISSLYGPVGTFLAWNRLPARAVVAGLAYLAFPPLVQYLEENVATPASIGSSELMDLVNSYLPGISIVLGTYLSLTMSILYQRLTCVQENVAREACVLAFTFSNLLELFEHDREAKRSGAQCVADQVGSLVHESRGREVMRIMYSDPYERILRLMRCRSAGGKLNPVSVARKPRVSARSFFDVAAARKPTPLNAREQSVSKSFPRCPPSLFRHWRVRCVDPSASSIDFELSGLATRRWA